MRVRTRPSRLGSAPGGGQFTNIAGYCRACNTFKHTQCARLLEDDGKCTCQCYAEETGTAFWAVAEMARHWPELAAAYAIICRSLRVCR
jgi:hypothetical protein